MRYLHFIIIFFICLLLSAHAASPSGQYPALRDQIDHKLQSALEHALLKKFGAGFTDLVGAKKVGIVIADITDPHKPKVAAINGDVMMYAASLPKIAIVLGAFVQIERGEMALDNDTRSLLVGMVRNSSNQAATEILHRVGIANLAQIIQSVYIITAMVEHPQGGQGLSELIVVVDDLLDSVYSRSLKGNAHK